MSVWRPLSQECALYNAGGAETDAMIIGLGSDLVDIRRIERMLEHYGERFVERIFTPAEKAKSERRAARGASYAKRFAAKEACSKALGTGLRQGVFWRDMGVVNLPFWPADNETDGRGVTPISGNYSAGHDRPHQLNDYRRLPPCPGVSNY